MKTKNKFYNFARDETTGGRELFIDGEIAQDMWFGDECTPGKFRDELFAEKGDITLWISSPGGDCFAASQIYTMLVDYQGNVTVKIYGMCASAASVIAMSGTKVLMSPTALLLIHNPWTIAVGDKKEFIKTGEFLDEVKETILNAYEIKTGLSRAKLSHLMDDETPMNVNKAIALGFCDGIIEDEKKVQKEPQIPENKTTVKSLYQRLNLISGGQTNV
ncbi:ATP-dependent Clp protease proteolytic subunit [Clostridia bacterium]|nr:ATP-dependent Clp protease proteolytic subunit [Clostridia bacterium]